MAQFTQDQLDALRREYSSIEGINPDSPTYKKLINKLTYMDQGMLQQLATAQIKFVSGLARNRVQVKAAYKTETATPSTSPTQVHAELLDKVAEKLSKHAKLENAAEYKKAIKREFMLQTVVPASQVERMTQWFLSEYPFTSYQSYNVGTVKEAKADPNGSWIAYKSPTVFKQFKTKAGAQEFIENDRNEGYKLASVEFFRYNICAKKHVHESRKLLNTEATGKRTAKIYKDSETQEYVVKFYIDGVYQKDADYFTDDKQDALGTAKAGNQVKKESIGAPGSSGSMDYCSTCDDVTSHSQSGACLDCGEHTVEESQTVVPVGEAADDPRDIKKEEPSAPSFDWVSKFDLGEIKSAMQVIIDHLADNEDPEQTDVLRNDIRVLDNLHAALSKQDGKAVDKAWAIVKSEGADEHLHDEFKRRMEDACATVSPTAYESFVAYESVTFSNKLAWDKKASKFRITESAQTNTAFDRMSGEMVGRWDGTKGWISPFVA